MTFHLLLKFVLILVSSKGETEPERKETRQKVDEDRKHEYPFQQQTIKFLLP